MFQQWYSAGCPPYRILAEKIQPDEFGRTPHPDFIKKWSSERQWYIRKDELNAKALEIMEEELVKQQVLMWKEQAARARAIAESAFDYLKETGFDSSASAVSGLKWAQEEERKTRGAEAFITSVKDASTDQLLQTIRQLAERHASAIEDEPEVIEAESKDVEEAEE